MIILLLSGYSGSGKDTFADIFIELCETLGVSYKKYAFAEEVKKDISKMYSVPLEMLYTQEGKRSIISTSDGNKTLRQLLIEYSADMKKKHGDDYWAQIVCKQFDNSNKIHIVSDWRYNIEYETVMNYFKDHATIKTIRIYRPDIKILEDCSEHELDSYKFDIILNNSTTVEALKIHAVELFKIVN